MANKSSFKKALAPAADAKNYSGALAYSMEAKHELTQLATTGCFNNTYYTTAEDQLDRVLTLARQVEPEFVAKVAVYARESGYMKDMPAALVAWLSTADPELTRKVFPRVINNGKMLRNFVQMIRSGAFGRHNVSSSMMKKMIHSWFDSRTDVDLFFQSVGSSPSMGDILKMARVRPRTVSRSALYAYFIGKTKGKFNGTEFEVADELPATVAIYEAYRKVQEGPLPSAPFEMLTGLTLSPQDWKEVATRATWNQTFKSLNTFARHGVFEDPALVQLVVEKLVDAEAIKKANAFPYQILMAYKAITDDAMNYGRYRSFGRATGALETASATPPAEVVAALETAMEIATRNVPSFEGKRVVVCPDVSGSMTDNYVTGSREGSSTKVRDIDVAALISASIIRRNPTARVIPFEGEVVPVQVAASSSIMQNAKVLSSIGGGSTNCAAPLTLLNQEQAKVDVVIFISDYESWSSDHGYRCGTVMYEQWKALQRRNPEAKLVCIDLTPHSTVQVQNDPCTLNVGGFSDTVFKVVEAFVSGGSKASWVEVVNQTQI